jgi:cold shock CspA family protein
MHRNGSASGTAITGTGRVLRFDDFRGFGFIEAAAGGADVFVHANAIEGGSALSPGAWVRYEAVEGDRGQKATKVEVLHDGPARQRVGGIATPLAQTGGDVGAEDDGLCVVLSEPVFTSSVTELLLTSVPELPAAQLVQIRSLVLEFAQRHGWVDS